MSVSDADIAFARDLFDDLGPLTHRRMMGGLCLYCHGTIFALLHGDGSIWLKGTGAFADRITRDGWKRWTYPRANGTMTKMPYWRLPDAALDDPARACDLARDAIEHLTEGGAHAAETGGWELEDERHG